MGRVHVVGYFSFDRLIVGGEDHRDIPGGGALYAALAARAEGADVALHALAGSDWPQAWLDALAAAGIDVSRVTRGATPTRRARFDGRADAPRANPHHDEAEWWARTAALAPDVPVDLRAGDVVALMPGPGEFAMRVSAAAGAAGASVVMDSSAGFARANGAAVRDVAAKVAVFAAGVEETRILLPDIDDDTAARHLARRGPAVLHKRGSAGALAIEAGGGAERILPAPRADVVETTGAGDATTGALAAGLAAGLPFFVAAERALAAGARCVGGIGPAAFGFPLGGVR